MFFRSRLFSTGFSRRRLCSTGFSAPRLCSTGFGGSAAWCCHGENCSRKGSKIKAERLELTDFSKSTLDRLRLTFHASQSMQSYDDAIDGMYHETSRANMILQRLHTHSKLSGWLTDSLRWMACGLEVSSWLAGCSAVVKAFTKHGLRVLQMHCGLRQLFTI